MNQFKSKKEFLVSITKNTLVACAIDVLDRVYKTSYDLSIYVDEPIQKLIDQLESIKISHVSCDTRISCDSEYDWAVVVYEFVPRKETERETGERMWAEHVEKMNNIRKQEKEKILLIDLMKKYPDIVSVGLGGEYSNGN